MALETEIKGKARLRYEDTQGYTTTTYARGNFWSIRIRPSFNFKVDDVVSVFAEPQFAKILGRDYSYAQTDSSGTTTYNENFHMHQGFIKLKFSDEFNARGGRFALDYGDAIIIGKSDWGLVGRAFDGIIFNYKNSFANIDASHVKLDSTANKLNEDKELAILYTSWTLLEALKALDLYALYEANMQSGANDHRNTFGARVKAKFSDLDLGVEYAMEKGSSTYISGDNSGLMLFAEIGYSLPEVMKMRFGFEYDQANEHWREWYPTTKSQLGRNDIVGRKNLTAIAARLKAEPIEKWSVSLDYWMYSRTSDSTTPFKTDGTTAVGSAATSTAKEIGTSLELSLAYKASDTVEYGVGGAMFTPAAYLKDNFTDNRTLGDVYAMVNVGF